MSEDLLRDLIIIASAEKQEIKVGNIKEAIKLRQKIYGRKTRLKRKDCMDIEGKAASEKVEVRILDMAGDAVVFNSPNYQEQFEQGLLDGDCYVVIQPILYDHKDDIEKALAKHIQSGTLPSQIAARREQEQAQKAMDRTKLISENDPFKKAMAMLPKYVKKPEDNSGGNEGS